MLSHKYRFHGHGSLRRVYRQGSVARAGGMSLRYLENPTRVHSRCSVVVSKKVLKHAVKRNRVRRRIYEVVRRHWDELNGPYDLIITVFDGNALIMPAPELESQVLQLLKNARVI
jgi:ribonuclease P protein component